VVKPKAGGDPARIAAAPGGLPLLFTLGALLVHFPIAWQLRVTAWPEVTTPGYLISRGLLLYRDIKFVHTPALMELLAGAFAVFGVSADTVRVVSIAWPIAAHAALLHETRAFRTVDRLWASGFFLSMFYAWQGSSLWPTVAIAALAIPIANALGRDRLRAAGLWIGLAILFKQTAALLLVVVVLRFAMRKRASATPAVLAWASLPYVLVGLLFAGLGAGRNFVHWTLLIPFQLHEDILLAPTVPLVVAVVAAFTPTLFEALLERPGEYEVSVRWHLLVAIGLLLAGYPRFQTLELVACLPCLAVGAARLLNRREYPFRALSHAMLAAITLPVALTVALGDRFDGRVVFWNDDPTIAALLLPLRILPPETPLLLDLWPNVLPLSGLLPPGRLYVHPWLPYLFEFDDVQKTITHTAYAHPTAFVGRYGTRSAGTRVGPYSIEFPLR
jgi:hypothetical protein